LLRQGRFGYTVEDVLPNVAFLVQSAADHPALTVTYLLRVKNRGVVSVAAANFCKFFVDAYASPRGVLLRVRILAALVQVV
jgi:hypothetical protein